MDNNKNIVCISNTTWEGFYTKSTVQLMSLLAKTNKVLFVEYPFTIKDLIVSLLGKANAPVSRMLGLKPRMVKKNSTFNTAVYQLIVPPMLPFAAFKQNGIYNLLLKINSLIYARSVRRALKKLKMADDTICVNAYNSIYGTKLLGKFNEKLHVFYCYDGPDVLRYGQRAKTADEKLARDADGLIVTSDFLAETMKHLNPNVTVVKNGVDFKLFNVKAKKEPRSGKSKKVGYIGSIDHRFDKETVEYAIQQLPEYEFEFVGDQMNKTVADQLDKYPNVTFYPPVKAHEVPELLQGCDVGLIPYLQTDYTKNIYPLKINEYLSVGVPVVLTAFADIPDFKDVAHFAKTKEEFLDAIVNEVENDSPERIKERIEFAEKTSWEHRAVLFDEILESYLAEKEKN
ncbi:glycosyltransferase [uncultured Draconibacterium sp.]|uniref:glycosyltransferase n=1 Tax=uncultured Draconibacterium sp. TaxID=1573823 RepID=UPI002AA731FD|nr:glycosyltransferase [uncultured Draconibacterium sp.]